MREPCYYRYGLRLRNTAGANSQSGRQMLEGFLIRSEGGYGCVQPWPELGDEPLSNIWKALCLGGTTPLLERALECCKVDGAARRSGQSLFEELQVPESHATVISGANFAALRGEGYRAVKLKGSADWRQVIETMKRAAGAGLRIRVDFNACLEAEDFVEFAAGAGSLKEEVDFVEDPVPWDPRIWEQLRQATGWRLALDRAGAGREVPQGYDVRILKPAADSMHPRATPVVVTSNMDHPVGQAWAAWEAARYPGVQDTAGLMTHHLIESNAFSDRLAGSGPVWKSPGGSGLGFDDLLEALPWRSPESSTCHSRYRAGAGVVMQNPRDPLPGGGPVLEQGAIGFATSGSTGRPSVVVHTEDTLKASSLAVNDWLAAKPEDVWLRVLPEFHVGGWQIGSRAGLSGSRMVVLEGKWEPEEFLRACLSEGITLTSLVPAQVVDLVRKNLHCPSSVRAIVVGGGGLDPAVLQKALVLGWPLLRSYGATEAGSQIATACLREPQNLTETWHPPLVLLPIWEAAVADSSGGKTGTLKLRGPALAVERHVWIDGAWQRQPLSDAAGWWLSSDKVSLNGQLLTFAGRSDRAVKVLGELVHLETMEAAFSAMGLEAGTFAVVPLPDERRGAMLVLVLERSSVPAEVSALLTEYNQSAPPFARIHSCTGIAGLPRSPLGKIRHGELAAILPGLLSLR